MKSTIMIAGAVGLSILGTGCATKKYVTQTVAPVQAQVATVEAKNADQDKQLADHAKQLDEMDKDLSRTKERVSDLDGKTTAAAQSAQEANQAAEKAQQSANNAQTYAEQSNSRLERTIDAVVKFQMSKSATVLFPVNQSKLSGDAKKQLDDFASDTSGHQRYLIEVQGFTDSTGPATLNDRLSQARAEAVARYLANEHKIPVRNISMLGSGEALPVADNKTRDGRMENRRVELRLFVPEASSATQTAQAGQQ
jgi:outer membrane protein OmpA-like peptidoglycan-associated protein